MGKLSYKMLIASCLVMSVTTGCGHSVNPDQSTASIGSAEENEENSVKESTSNASSKLSTDGDLSDESVEITADTTEDSQKYTWDESLTYTENIAKNLEFYNISDEYVDMAQYTVKDTQEFFAEFVSQVRNGDPAFLDHIHFGEYDEFEENDWRDFFEDDTCVELCSRLFVCN